MPRRAGENREGRYSLKRFITTIVALGIVYLVIGGIYIAVAKKPKIYVVFTDIPSLDEDLRSINDSSASFVLLLSNSNRYAGVYYDNITVSLYDGQNRSVSIGNYSFGRFYQGFTRQATRGMKVKEDNIRRIKRSVNGSVIIWFDVATKVRLRGIIGRTGRKGIHVGNNVTVNSTANEITQQIRLNAGTKAALSSSILAFLAIVYTSQLL